MKVSPKRLATLLSHERFRLTYSHDATSDYVYERSGEPGLFERIWVNGRGKSAEAVVCYVGVSVARGLQAVKGLIEIELLQELATEASRGYALITSDPLAREWEQRVVTVAPGRIAALKGRVAASLLQTTENARLSAQEYVEEVLRRVDADRTVADALRKAQEATTKAEQQLLYEVVLGVVKRRARAFEGEVYEVGRIGMLNDPELLWRVELTVDQLLASGVHQ